jgi:IclR family transcriptional regulator, KDG regulon repressor
LNFLNKNTIDFYFLISVIIMNMKKTNDLQNQKSTKQDQSSVQAVDRALLLLKLVAQSDHPISIGELADMSNINRTTAWRLIGTLEHHGFVERDLHSKAYQLGYEANQLASKVPQYNSLVRRSRRSMEKLREEIQETVLLSVPKHNGTLTIEQIDPEKSVRLVVNYVNAFLPLHSTSNGKLLLSLLPPKELDIFLERPLEQVTPNTITDPEQLRKEIMTTSERGFGTSIGELDENENGISASIFDKSHNLIGFMSVCGPSFRFTKEKMHSYSDLLITTCKEITEYLE